MAIDPYLEVGTSEISNSYQFLAELCHFITGTNLDQNISRIYVVLL